MNSERLEAHKVHPAFNTFAALREFGGLGKGWNPVNPCIKEWSCESGEGGGARLLEFSVQDPGEERAAERPPWRSVGGPP